MSADMTCAAEADNLAGVLETLRNDKRIALTLLDVDLLGASEGTGLRYLVDRYPDSRFAVLVTYLNQQVIDQLISEGAAGCIPKNLPADALVDAFRVVRGVVDVVRAWSHFRDFSLPVCAFRLVP